ncbi:hypothetical protein ACFQH6_19720 [Halobacteriaceae archaeon GCM10025711]
MAQSHLTRRTALRLGGTAVAAALVGTPVQGKARPNAVFDLDFSSSSDATATTATDAGWVVDRQAPAAWTTDPFMGDDRLRVDVDGDAPTSGFYAYQGEKYQDAGGSYWHAGTGSRLSYRFYVDPAWETDDVGQETGVWPVLGDADGDISAYPILAYQDSDANENDEPGFRAYVYETDADGTPTARWEHVGLPKHLGIDPEEGGWVTVEAQLQRTNEGAALKWRIDDKLVLDERGYNVFAPSTQYLEFIVNSVNFGVDQTYYYDDFVLTEPGQARHK